MPRGEKKGDSTVELGVFQGKESIKKRLIQNEIQKDLDCAGLKKPIHK